MAQRRMFSPQIIDSDAFLDMSPSAQSLYFHLGMRADDDGFVGNPRKILRMVGGNEDDLKMLLAKRFILAFENGVIVIKHWRINNLVRKDWYHPTQYIEQKSQLFLKENGAYTEDKTQGEPLLIVNENTPIRQHRLGKVRLGKVIGDKIETHTEFLKSIPEEDLKELSTRFNCSPAQIKGKAEDLLNYCLAKGRVYKDYRAFLRNAVKKDFGDRPPAPKAPPKVDMAPEQIAKNKEALAKLKVGVLKDLPKLEV